MGNDRNLQDALGEVKVPIVVINSASWAPTDFEAAQRHGIEVKLIPDVGHFVMIEAPDVFNTLVDEAVKKFVARRPTATR